MNNPLFIIDTYPSEEIHLNILNRCIDALIANGSDVMIVSHLPIPKEIYQKAKYFIYDFNNTFLPAEYTPFFWMNYPTFDLKIYNGGHTLPICRNIRSSTTFAKAMGYTHFVFLEYDVVLSKTDYGKLLNLIYEMGEKGKKMLFFRPEEYRGTEGSYVYETLLFSGELEFFIKEFPSPIDLTQWIDMNMGYTLEQSFYEQMGKKEEQYLIVNEHSSQTFKESEVNLMRYGLFNCEVVHNDLHEDEPVLFIMNSLIDESPKFGDIFINGAHMHSSTFYKGVFWYNSYRFDDSLITVKIYTDEEKKYLLMQKDFKLSINNRNTFREKGFIKFKPE